jgi:ubiquinone/menaquinone biosynthesis C-methylase UbiE
LIVKRLTPAWAAGFAFLTLQAALIAQSAVHPVTGRPIAQVMSHLGASWLDRPEREDEEAPSKAVTLLALKPGAVVADVGAGSGYISEKLSRAVGPTGRVYAVDIQPEMIALIDARVKKEGLANITTVLGEPDDPKLPDGAVDLELMVDVYHELQHPQVVLRRLRRALRPDGRLVLLEYRKEDPSVPIRADHKMTVADAKAELEAEGFHLSDVNEALPRQHLLVFTRTAAPDR